MTGFYLRRNEANWDETDGKGKGHRQAEVA